ncbi:MAG: hypothetical protein LBT00_08595 [Spirochaetaceae bacterium]|jgi:hypothetical protein|nr:hypothetical protein [Spirochaetaceae bacterium]
MKDIAEKQFKPWGTVRGSGWYPAIDLGEDHGRDLEYILRAAVPVKNCVLVTFTGSIDGENWEPVTQIQHAPEAVSDEKPEDVSILVFKYTPEWELLYKYRYVKARLWPYPQLPDQPDPEPWPDMTLEYYCAPPFVPPPPEPDNTGD